MSTSIPTLFVLVAALASAPAFASTRVAVYAIIDTIEFEPSNLEPDRAWISGVFVLPTPVSSGLHEAPVRGHLYFSVNPSGPAATRADWDALRSVAGTGKPVGFGEYWMSCSQSRAPGFPHTAASNESNCSFEATVQDDRTRATPELYPISSSEGVVTVFDAGDDLCPRFGRPSVEIIAALREAHSPDAPRAATPVCAEWVGLVPSSQLASVFRVQVRDDEWADATEAMILGRLADVPGLKLAELSVQCRDTVCRLHFAFPTGEYQDATGNRLVADALDEVPGLRIGWIHSGSDAPTIDYYFQRRKTTPATAGE